MGLNPSNILTTKKKICGDFFEDSSEVDGSVPFQCNLEQFLSFSVSGRCHRKLCAGCFSSRPPIPKKLEDILSITDNLCTLGFTPFSASLLFGLSLVALLLKHPELYPSWLRRVNFKIMFLYELVVSLIFIEIGFCLWNSVETFLFYRIPAFLEEYCSPMGDFYIRIVETEIGVSIISNALALALLLFTLHITRICNFNLLLRSNGVHKFFADAGLTSNLCRHHRQLRQKDIITMCIPTNVDKGYLPIGDCYPPMAYGPCRACIIPKTQSNRCPKMLRSGKKFY